MAQQFDFQDIVNLVRQFQAVFGASVRDHERILNLEQDFVKVAKEKLSIAEKVDRLTQNHVEQLKSQKDLLEEIRLRIADAKARGEDPSLIRYLETEARGLKQSISAQSISPLAEWGGNLFNTIQQLSGTIHTLTSGIEKWIDFNVRMQNMQTEAIKTGWENIAVGQTPFMSKTIGMMTDYTNRMRENDAEKTKATIGIITSLASIAGGAVGAYFGGGVGFMAGATTAGTVVQQVAGSFMRQEEAEMKERMIELDTHTRRMGMMNEIQNQVRGQRVGIAQYLSSSGLGGTSVSMDAISGVRENLRNTEKFFAGIQGFTTEDQTQLLQMMGLSKQFAGADQEMLGQNVALMSKTTGLGQQDIMNYLIELRVRLKTPIDELQTTFGSLADISDKFQIPLKQVMSDFMELARINQRYGFTQNELLGLYSEFTDEIKKGTISMADFQKFLEGMSQTSTEKAIGIGALLQGTNKESILSNVGVEDRGGVSNLLNIISGMQTPDVGMFLKMASQPNAEKNPFMQQLMSQYNITQADLTSVQPYISKSLLGLSMGYGGATGGAGIGQMVYESFGNMTGLGLAPDYYTQGLQTRGIGALGTSGQFSGQQLGQGMSTMYDILHRNRNEYLAKEIDYFENLVPLSEKWVQGLKEGKSHIEAYADIALELDSRMKQLFGTMEKEFISMIEKLMSVKTQKREQLEKEEHISNLPPDVGYVMSNLERKEAKVAINLNLNPQVEELFHAVAEQKD